MAAQLFVESNFLLELVFQQEQYAACQRLLAMAQAGQVQLLLPMVCLPEPIYKLDGQQKKRRALNKITTSWQN